MNPEIESTQTKITQSGPKALAQGIFRLHTSHEAGTNSRDVEHEYEPLAVSPAEQAFTTGVIR
jgi:hypothetical protein